MNAITISQQKGENWVGMWDVVLVGGVAAGVVPEKGVGAVAVGGGAGVGGNRLIRGMLELDLVG